jgi:hypothetical protein
MIEREREKERERVYEYVSGCMSFNFVFEDQVVVVISVCYYCGTQIHLCPMRD